MKLYKLENSCVIYWAIANGINEALETITEDLAHGFAAGRELDEEVAGYSVELVTEGKARNTRCRRDDMPDINMWIAASMTLEDNDGKAAIVACSEWP